MTETNTDYYGENSKRNSNENKNENGPGNEHGSENQETTLANQRANEYVKELLSEKLSLDHHKQPNCMRLIEQEVTKTQQLGRVPPRDNRFVDIYREKPIKASVKVLVPVREHPKFNFVGKLLGPKGNSLKRLQEETMCKMAVLGRGSMRDRQKEEEFRQSLDPKYSHLMEDLHVEISALGPPAEAYARLAYALAEVRKYLIPDSNDNIRQEQMREMEIIGETTHTEERPRKSVMQMIKSGAGPGPRVTQRTATRAPVVTPRVMPAKTKILSILDRARIAMEESYGGYDERDRYPPPPTDYEYSRYVDRYDEYDDYYAPRGVPSYVPEPPPRSWKPSYKSSSSSNLRHSESSRYRTSPYSRPPK